MVQKLKTLKKIVNITKLEKFIKIGNGKIDKNRKNGKVKKKSVKIHIAEKCKSHATTIFFSHFSLQTTIENSVCSVLWFEKREDIFLPVDQFRPEIQEWLWALPMQI